MKLTLLVALIGTFAVAPSTNAQWPGNWGEILFNLTSNSSAASSQFPTRTAPPSATVSPSEAPSDTPPSISPSVVPSDMPSDIPSQVPSRDPSDVPSSIPSQGPSVSDIPSAVPSAEPTLLASDAPSSVPSGFPSIMPSDFPSTVPTTFPSDVPSSQPSIFPTDIFSDMPSTLPSFWPSAVPSMSPSSSWIPTSRPSQGPSGRPSDNPSSFPSPMPTTEPSRAPSRSPSELPTISDSPSSVPSRKPSQSPSWQPTQRPSQAPSPMPSISPSVEPSSLPSIEPSSSPTFTCHDEAPYRSPLNNFECKDHQGTDCMKWRFLGLDIEQVIDLVRSCPESCNITCGSLTPFEVTLTFGIFQVSSFLAPSGVATLEAVSAEYLTNYIQAQERESRFFVYDVELLSQNILGAERRLRARPSRWLSSTVKLAVVVSFRAYAIDLEIGAVKEYLVHGIDSPAYVRSLQRSGDPSFMDVQIAFDVETEPATAAVADESGGGKAIIAASVVISVVTVFAAAAFFIHLQRRKVQKVGKQAAGFGASSVVVSPVASMRSSLAQVLSFDSILRMVSSPRSDESATVAAVSSSSSEKPDPVQLAQSSSEEEIDEEHPLTGIIPPMIVFENIDDERHDEDEDDEPRVKCVVPSMRMYASPELVAKLRDGSGEIDEIFVASPQHHVENLILSLEEAASKPSQCSCGSSSGEGKVDKRVNAAEKTDNENDDNGDEDCSSQDSDSNSDGRDFAALDDALTSVSSAPNPAPSIAEANHRDVIETKGFRKCISESQIGLRPGVPSRRMIGLRRRKPSVEDIVNTVSMDLDFSQLNEILEDERSTIDRGFHLVDSKHCDSSGGFMHSIFNMSPGRKMRRGLSSSTDGSPHSTSSGTAKTRRTNNTKDSDSNVGKPSLLCKPGKGKQLTFPIPRHGKLGLTILCDGKGGPKVQHVKDYSPLLGKAIAGDRIVSIDGVATLGATLSEITSLLVRRAGSRWPHSNTMDVVFWRSNDEDNDAGDDESVAGEIKADNESSFDSFTKDYSRDESGSNASRPGLPLHDGPSHTHRNDSSNSLQDVMWSFEGQCQSSHSASIGNDMSDEDLRQRF